ncbi:unnamed protein product [Discosporangium mesarthrocarpum]
MGHRDDYSGRRHSGFGSGGYGGSHYGGGHYGSDFGGDRMSGLVETLRRIKWDLNKLPKFDKNFHIQHLDVSYLSEEESNRWRRSVGIHILGEVSQSPFSPS